MSSKDLLNDSVLTDAYLKLATAEKKLGHYAKPVSIIQSCKR